MFLGIERFREEEFGDLEDRVTTEHERPEERLLGFEVLGWEA
jgi:hypothetical protein